MMTTSVPFSSAIGTLNPPIRVGAAANTIIRCNRGGQRVRCLRSNESYPVKLGHWETAMGIKSYTAAPTALVALGLFFTPAVSIAIDATINPVGSLVSPAIGNLSFISPAMGQPDAP